MAEASDWATLQDRCQANGAWLGLRVETFKNGAEHRYALSATEKKPDGKALNELRATTTDNAPQSVVTGLVTAALSQWWP